MPISQEWGLSALPPNKYFMPVPLLITYLPKPGILIFYHSAYLVYGYVFLASLFLCIHVILCPCQTQNIPGYLVFWGLSLYSYNISTLWFFSLTQPMRGTLCTLCTPSIKNIIIVYKRPSLCHVSGRWLICQPRTDSHPWSCAIRTPLEVNWKVETPLHQGRSQDWWIMSNHVWMFLVHLVMDWDLLLRWKRERKNGKTNICPEHWTWAQTKPVH